ncbi:hypothetical protein BTVI_03206 [Pitangus sulphuratus]|nr:hypothetical protein BTVI_03206 [Pitangus sulphuratus]
MESLCCDPRVDLMSEVEICGCLGHSDHEVIEFKIISFDSRKSANKTSTLDRRRADFWLPRELQSIPLEKCFCRYVDVLERPKEATEKMEDLVLVILLFWRSGENYILGSLTWIHEKVMEQIILETTAKHKGFIAKAAILGHEPKQKRRNKVKLIAEGYGPDQQ